MKWAVSGEQEVEKKQQSMAEERQHQEEVAAAEGWRREPQKEFSQDKEWEKVESMGTEGDERIDTARKTIEAREREQRK